MESEKFYAPCEEGYRNTSANGKDDATIYLRDFTPIVMEGANVTDAIGDQYKQWDYSCPVLIDAPTGSGKTTFVCKKLIPSLYPEADFGETKKVAMELNAIKVNINTLLLVSNRAALVRQQKEKVVNALEPYYVITDDSLNVDDYQVFDRVAISSYQGLVTMLKTAERNPHLHAFFRQLKYVIFDEIHFLYADSTFNEDASILLEELPVVFNSVIRIYMTATSWSIRKSLLYAERNARYIKSTYLPRQLQIGGDASWALSFGQPKPIFYHYQMAGNYDAYRLNFFNRHGDCTDAEDYDPDLDPYLDNKGDVKGRNRGRMRFLDALINLFPKPSPDRRLLIFVKKKKHGEYLAKYYNDAKIPARFVDSSYRRLAVKYRESQIAPQPIVSKVVLTRSDGSKSENLLSTPTNFFTSEDLEKIEFWNSFIRNEKYSETVLIATSVLDCGVNIHDDTVRDIVIFADDPTAFMQMLGRKRISRNFEEKVDLWVYIPPRQSFSTQIQAKQLEIELGEKVSLAEKYTDPNDKTLRPDLLRNVWNSYGQIQDTFYARVERRNTVMHEGILNVELAKKYPGTTYKTLYRELWSHRQRVTDKALLHIDHFGQITASKYVLWVIKQQLAYYQKFVLDENPSVFRDEVCKWLGRYAEVKEKQDLAKQAIVELLEKHIGKPIEDPNEMALLRKLVYTAAQICLDVNPLSYNFEKIHPSTISKVLKSLRIEYTVSSIQDKNHQKTKWLVEAGWKEGTE